MSGMSRRAFVRRTAAAGAGLALAAASGAGYSVYGEPNWLDVVHVDVPIDALPAELDGLVIGHLTDLHHSDDVAIAHIDAAIDAIQQSQPDIIALTGDYLTHSMRFLPAVAASISRLAAPHGVYAVLGNHDHWSGDPRGIARALTGVGVDVLWNAHRRMLVGNTPIYLAGVGDVWEREADIDRATAGMGEGVRLLLAHEPDFADVAAGYGFALQLSGHSHGGQVRLPFIGAPLLPRYGQKYPIGLQQVAGTELHVYTGRGVGLVSPAVRFNCRPEATLLTLRRAV